MGASFSANTYLNQIKHHRVESTETIIIYQCCLKSKTIAYKKKINFLLQNATIYSNGDWTR